MNKTLLPLFAALLILGLFAACSTRRVVLPAADWGDSDTFSSQEAFMDETFPSTEETELILDFPTPSGVAGEVIETDSELIIVIPTADTVQSADSAK